MRGLLHLFRNDLCGVAIFKRENAAIRTASRNLSLLRDADVMLETCNAIIQARDKETRKEEFGWITQAFRDRRKELNREKTHLADKLDEYRSAITDVRQRVNGWLLRSDGFDSVRQGLEETYQRCITEMDTALREYTDDAFHEWRKVVKYHRYHCRLLGPVWTPVMRARHKQTQKLSEYLGDDHDLAVMRQIIRQEKECRFSARDNAEQFIHLLNAESERLRYESNFLGTRLFTESAEDFTERIHGYWECWRNQKKVYSVVK